MVCTERKDFPVDTEPAAAAAQDNPGDHRGPGSHHDHDAPHGFDKADWEDHWAAAGAQLERTMPVAPYIPLETARRAPTSALDAGCGTGIEATWLAGQGWQVTGADISVTALAAAARRSEAEGVADRTAWVETDLTRWEPRRTWDLVVSVYAHPDSGQLSFYRRIASWVAPGGTLLIVGHLPGSHGGHRHPEGATATAAAVERLFALPAWHIEASYENTRTVPASGRELDLHDVVVRARRIA